MIRLHRKFYSGAAKKLPVKGLKNLHVISVYVKQTINSPVVFVRPTTEVEGFEYSIIHFGRFVHKLLNYTFTRL